MTNQCIEKTISDVDYKKLLPDINSTTNIWIMSDDESDEEESLSNDHTVCSGNICFVISNLWIGRDKHTNTYCAVTVWMLCVITHIREDFFNNSNVNNKNQVNIIIKTIFYD